MSARIALSGVWLPEARRLVGIRGQLVNSRKRGLEPPVVAVMAAADTGTGLGGVTLTRCLN
jgi:hypothetical protein